MKRTLVVVSVLVANVAWAEMWVVLPDGLGDAPTIQAAVDSASAGDEVQLANGTFAGLGNVNVEYKGKAITVRSISGDPSQCIIDCSQFDDCWGNTGFLFRNGEGAGSLLEGVTILYAWGGIFGDICPEAFGAIVCQASSPTIRNVIVTQCLSGVDITHGGSPRFENVRIEFTAAPALRSANSTPTITGCVLSANTSSGTGLSGRAGLSLFSSNATIENTRIEGHRDGGVYLLSSSPLLRGCVIVDNIAERGAGIYLASASSPSFESCTITRNLASERAGGIFVSAGSNVSLDRTILWGNCSDVAGDDIYLGVGGVVNAVCSDIRQSGIEGSGIFNADTDVIDVPPNFCDPEDCEAAPSVDGDYFVDDDSPVVTASCGLMGALAANCTIHVENTTWGAIKSLYR